MSELMWKRIPDDFQIKYTDDIVSIKKAEISEEHSSVLFTYKGKGYSYNGHTGVNDRGQKYNISELAYDDSAIGMKRLPGMGLRLPMLYATLLLEDRGVDVASIDKRII